MLQKLNTIRTLRRKLICDYVRNSQKIEMDGS